jgi:hypothetical protein
MQAPTHHYLCKRATPTPASSSRISKGFVGGMVQLILGVKSQHTMSLHYVHLLGFRRRYPNLDPFNSCWHCLVRTNCLLYTHPIVYRLEGYNCSTTLRNPALRRSQTYRYAVLAVLYNCSNLHRRNTEQHVGASSTPFKPNSGQTTERGWFG